MRRYILSAVLCGLVALSAVSCGKDGKSSEKSSSAESAAETTKAAKTEEKPEEAAPEAENTDTAEVSGGEAAPVTEEIHEEAEENVDEEAQNTVRELIKVMVEDADAEAAAKVMYPSSIVESLKEDGTLLEKVYGGVEYEGGVKVEDITVSMCEPLSEKTMSCAETYYESYSEVNCGKSLDITVADGREVEFSFKAVGTDDSWETTQKCVVVKTLEEGYKIINIDAESLDILAD